MLVDGNLEYEVEAILRHRGKGARRQYLVSWKDYDLSEATWEPESHLANAPDILADYLRRVQTSERSMWNRGAIIIAEGAGEDCCRRVPERLDYLAPPAVFVRVTLLWRLFH